jgi:4-amino-4-deoxy-L-arabinose transferase-like glycosyltransferase
MMRGLALHYAGSALLALVHYAALGVAAALAWIYGRRLTSRIAYRTALEQTVFSIGIGLGAIAYLVMLLGMLHLLYAPVLATLLAFGALLCAPLRRECLKQPGECLKRLEIRAFLQESRASITGICIAAVLLLPLLALPLYPPTEWDATALHLAAAKIYITEHALVFTPFLRYPVFPQTAQMLFTAALMLGDDLLAQLTEWLMLGVLAAAVAACGERYLTRRAGWWGAALLLSSPIVLRIGSAAYVDIGLALYVFLGCYAFWNWLESKQRSWIALAGVLLGLAFSVKYPALFFILLLAPYAFIAGKGNERWRAPLLMCGAAFAVALPWLARNFYYTRNPLFPFYYGLFAPFFGYGRWSPEYLGWLLDDKPGRGVERTLAGLFRLPWELTTNIKIFEAETTLSPLYLLLLPVTILAAVWSRSVRRLLFAAASFTLFWWATYQIVRYLFPALPLLSLAAAGAVDELSRRMAWIRNIASRRAWAATVGAALLLPGWGYASKRLLEKGPPPASEGGRDLYITLRLPTYPLYQFLNRRYGRDYTVYSLYDENMFYFADGRMMGDWFGPGGFDPIIERLNDGEALYGELHRLGADHLILDLTGTGSPMPNDEAFRTRFRLLMVRAHSALFDMTDRRIERVIGANLLADPGFEAETEPGADAAGWVRYGGAQIDRTMSYSGNAAAVCSGTADFLLQKVEVLPGAIYSLRYAALAETDAVSARLQIDWFGESRIEIGWDMQVVDLGREWKVFETDMIAPPGAAYGIVHLRLQSGGRARFDEVSLSTVTFQEER